MKRITALLVTAVLLIPLVSIGVFASASIDVSGPSKAYPGDTVTLTVKLDTADITGARAVMFDMVFDTEQMTYKSSSGILSGWDVTEKKPSSGVVRMLFECDNEGGDDVSGKTLIKVNFTLSNSLAKGESVSVTFKKISISSTENEANPSDVTCSVDITKKSSDATLYSLSVSGATLSPAFSSDKTSYTTDIDYRTKPLTINYKTTDSKATAKVSGNSSLKVGKNTITITVTAEDGTTKKYTIVANMAENPNPESSDCTLSDVKISSGTITPEFKSNVYEYTVNVPADVDKITMDPTPNDSKATAEKKIVSLTKEETEVTVTCTAEDGSKKNYVFTIVKEMSDETNDGTDTNGTDSETPADTDIVTEDVVTDEITQATPDTDYIPENEETDAETDADTRPVYNENTGFKKPVPLWSVLLCSIVSLVIGAVISALIFKRKF